LQNYTAQTRLILHVIAYTRNLARGPSIRRYVTLSFCNVH